MKRLARRSRPVAESESLRHQLNRLYDLEREERNERRGLEQRAATVVGAVLVTLGLAANALAGGGAKDDPVAATFIVVGVAWTFFGGLFATFALAGVHTSDEMSLKRALTVKVASAAKSHASADFRNDRAIADVALEPAAIDAKYVAQLHARVARLTYENGRLVAIIRVASLTLGIGVYLVIFGAGVAILS